MQTPVHAAGVEPACTRTQGQYLAFIYYYTKIHGVPPAEADMQRYFQTSPPAIHQMIVTLEKAGVVKKLVFIDKASGAKAARPGLDACLRELRENDTLVVWRLDRLGRSVRHLIDLVEQLHQRKVGFKSLCDGAIDTTTASGELIFHIFTALAQFERRLIQERTKAGLNAARARGRKGGRPPIAADDPRIQTAKKLHADKAMSIPAILQTLKISRPTLYRWLAKKSPVTSS